MQARLHCDKILSNTSIASMGDSPQCTWKTDYKMVATVRSNANVNVMDDLKLHQNAVIHTSAHYSRVIQSDDTLQNARVVVAQPGGLTLTSPRLTPICRPAMFPEGLKPYADLEAVPVLVDPSPFQDFVSSSASVYFNIDGENYVVIANFCRGQNCRYDQVIKFTSAEYDIFSSIYKWNADGTFTFFQAIKTQGAMDVKAFQAEDSREDGPRGQKQFLVFANYYTKNKDPVKCPTPTDCTANATVWQYNYLTKQFTLRQNIDHVAYCTSVDVREHNGLLFLVATSSVAVDYISVYKWVEGSFRIDEVNGWFYGWDDDQKFGWVPASFSDFVQDIPTSSASDCHLYHAGDDFCLAVSNYAIGTSTQAPVGIYKWNDVGCSDTQLGGCFEYLTQLPALGAKSVMSFSSHPTGTQVRHFVAVANSFEGDLDVEVPSHSIKNSYVYMVNYQTGKYELIQAIQTASAQAVRVFEYCGFPACRTFLAVSNMKGFEGLTHRSKLYKLSDRRDQSLINGTCAISQIEQFEEVLDVPTVGGVELFFVENKNDKMPYIFSVLSNGGVGLQIFNLEQVVPKPRPVIDYSRFYGPCDSLLLDARASMNSGGRAFIVRWKLVEYTPSDQRKSVCTSVQCAPPAILKAIRDALLYTHIDIPIIPEKVCIYVYAYVFSSCAGSLCLFSSDFS